MEPVYEIYTQKLHFPNFPKIKYNFFSMAFNSLRLCNIKFNKNVIFTYKKELFHGNGKITCVNIVRIKS